MQARPSRLSLVTFWDGDIRLILIFGIGLLFGLVLLVSGMANPARALGLRDLAGDWDPSLAFVMGGATAIGLPIFGWGRRHSH